MRAKRKPTWTAERRARYHATLQAKKEQKHSPTPVAQSKRVERSLIYYVKLKAFQVYLIWANWRRGDSLQVMSISEFENSIQPFMAAFPELFHEGLPTAD